MVPNSPMTTIPQGLPLRQLIELGSPMPPFIQELREKIRNGKKWQTRRPLNPQPAAGVRQSVFVKSGLEDGHGYELHPKYPDGLRYLREPLCKGADGLAHYRDDQSVVIDRDGQYIKWRWQRDVLTQIFMPRDAARFFVNWEVVGIQRIMDIKIEEVKAEGIGHTLNYGPILYEEFKRLWNSINAKRAFDFDSNPYVWVYEFHPYQRGNQ